MILNIIIDIFKVYAYIYHDISSLIIFLFQVMPGKKPNIAQTGWVIHN
jgi:hypothetical protein